MSDISLITTDWMHDLDDIRAVRKTVFIQEQNVPEQEEWDHWDPVSQHILAYHANRDAVGTARVQPDGKITRMAVLAA
ncbi:MAG: GNAT family N-acyltransferase, partial [Pseudomonadota bacterium]